MKKIMFIISVSLLLLNISLVNAEIYKNLDKIEVSWYFHTSLLVWDSCWGWAWDWRFSNWWFAWFSNYKELKDFFDNSASISCQNVSLWTINNIETSKNYTDVINTNKTWSWEYMLFPSKDFMSNIAKNPIFKDNISKEKSILANDPMFKNNKNEIMKINNQDLIMFLQSEFFKWKQVKITWKYYHIKWKYSYTTDFTWEQNVDLDLNIVIVDDISFPEAIKKTEPNMELVNEFKTRFESYVKKKKLVLTDYDNFIEILSNKVKLLQAKSSKNSELYVTLQAILDYLDEANNDTTHIIENLFD